MNDIITHLRGGPTEAKSHTASDLSLTLSSDGGTDTSSETELGLIRTLQQFLYLMAYQSSWFI